MEKITETMLYEEIKTLCADRTDIIEFCDRKIGQLANKAAKTKEKAAEKKAAGDELREVIASCLTKEPQIADDILAKLEGEDLSIGKVRARLSQLVNMGLASKIKVKLGDKEKVAYIQAVN